MTIHEAASILQHPERYYSHHKDDAIAVAVELLLAVDDMITELESPSCEDVFDKYPGTVEHITGTRPV